MKRYDLIDTLRGISVISMILFHACWIMNHFGLLITSEMLFSPSFTAWERSICIPFIAIAGFSFSFGHNHLKTGLLLSGIGATITLATCLLVPDIRIVFGVLTLIGISVLLMIPIDKAIGKKVSESLIYAIIAFTIAIGLFLFFYNINKGFLGIPGLIALPRSLYKGYFATFIGFMDPGFYSSDYFSVLPWFFLYAGGYFLNKIIIGRWSDSRILRFKIPGINVIGRHSLHIYIIHPIVLYLIFYVVAQNVYK